jgi:lysophospholipase L1-like esterase
MKMKSLIVLWALILPVLANTTSTLPASAEQAKWEPAIAAFEATDRQHPPAPGAILFIGSSSIEHWKSLAADFPELSVINRGFGGSELADSTYFADRIVAPYRPRAVVLYAGDNDLQDGHSPAQVRDDFAAFVRKVRSVDAGVPIAFIAIKPSMARKALLPQVSQANALIKTYAATQKRVTYLDVYTPMLGADGQPQPKWFGDDGLHMNRSGYALWIGIIRPWVDAVPHKTPAG